MRPIVGIRLKPFEVWFLRVVGKSLRLDVMLVVVGQDVVDLLDLF